MNCARYLGVYDLDLIYSWTPREYRNFLKGARLRIIDETEQSIINAVLSGAVSRSTEKRLSPKKFFDADKARKEILEDTTEEKVFAVDRFKKAKNALKNFMFGKKDEE